MWHIKTSGGTCGVFDTVVFYDQERVWVIWNVAHKKRYKKFMSGAFPESEVSVLEEL